MKKFFPLVITILLFTCFAAAPCAAKTTWNANSVWPPNNHHSIGLNDFAALVKTKTGGELDIVVNAGGALGYKGPELLKAVRDGLLPLSDMLISGVAGDARIFQIVTLPFLLHSFEEAKLMNDLARPYFDKTAAKWKQKILYVAPWPGAGLWTKNKIVKLDDLKDLKTRTYDKNGALVVKATGGTPYALPFSEVYSSLATGLIDSVITSSPTAVDGKFWEVLKYFQRLNITIATNMVTVNLRAFNKLDPKVQKALVAAGREMEEIMWKKVAELDKQKEQLCNEKGIKTVPVSAEFVKELNTITEDIRAKWLKKAPADAKALYKEFMDTVER